MPKYKKEDKITIIGSGMQYKILDIQTAKGSTIVGYTVQRIYFGSLIERKIQVYEDEIKLWK